MKFTPLVIAAVVGSAAALDRADYMPECSLECLNNATKEATDCSLDDAVCWCVKSNYDAIYNAGVSCILSECGLDKATGEVLPAAARFCLAATSSAAAAKQTSDPTIESTTAATTPAATTPAATTPAGNNTAALTSGPVSTPAASPSGAGEEVKSTSTQGGAAPTAGAAVGVLFVAGALAAL